MPTIEERIVNLITFFRGQDIAGMQRQIDAIQNSDGAFEFNWKNFTELQLQIIAETFKARLVIIYNPHLRKVPKAGMEYVWEMEKELHLREMSNWIDPSKGFIEEEYV